MKIRKATLKDLARIDEIYVEGSIDESEYQFSSNKLKEVKKDLKKYQFVRRQGFRKYMKSKKHYWIVAEEDKNILGFGEAWIKNKDTGVTESVHVDRRYRKEGVGKRIMKEMIKWLKKQKLKHIESSCYANNKPSLEMHKKLGFKPLVLKMRLGK